jgi:hypothetical protein
MTISKLSGLLLILRVPRSFICATSGQSSNTGRRCNFERLPTLCKCEIARARSCLASSVDLRGRAAKTPLVLCLRFGARIGTSNQGSSPNPGFQVFETSSSISEQRSDEVVESRRCFESHWSLKFLGFQLVKYDMACKSCK